MQIGPFTLARTKALQLSPLSARGGSGSGGWWPWGGVIRESFTGAWQQNVEIRGDTALSYYAVYACTRLIATDIGKLCLRLVQQDDDGVWTDTKSAAFSPVLRKPNRYQTINKYVEQYMLSKLLTGNAYVLKQRDHRRVVTALYVLDPSRVTPLVASDGSVYYEVKRDDLSGLTQEERIFPASEIIHDTMITPFHPLIGVSPLFACGLAATQGLSIQTNSNRFFSNGANPSGMLTAPGAISDDTAKRLKDKFDGGGYSGENVGKVVVAGDGLKFEQFTMSAVDAQLIEQLRMTAEQVCSAFGVPPYLVDIGAPPPYANFEPLLLKYHSQCIQSLTTNFEKCHDDGLGLLEPIDGTQYGTEFDIDDLIWMDTVTRVTSAKTAIEGGGMSPDEARFKYHGLGPTPGGSSVLAQQQNFSLAALAKRDAGDPFATPDSSRVVAPDITPATDMTPPADMQAAFMGTVLQKVLEGLRAA
jgi:HK97 family phage portal protein